MQRIILLVAGIHL